MYHVQPRFLFHADLLPPQHLLHRVVLPERLHVLCTAHDDLSNLGGLAHPRIGGTRALLRLLRARAEPLERAAPPIVRAHGELGRRPREHSARTRIVRLLDSSGTKPALEVLLHTAEGREAEAEETVLLGQRHAWRGRRPQGGTAEGITEDVEQGHDRADEVELDNGSPRRALLEPCLTRVLHLEICRITLFLCLMSCTKRGNGGGWRGRRNGQK